MSRSETLLCEMLMQTLMSPKEESIDVGIKPAASGKLIVVPLFGILPVVPTKVWAWELE